MSNPPPTPATNPRQRRIALSVLGLALVAIVVGYKLKSAPASGVEPPRPDLASIDPEVRKAIEDASAKVKATPNSGPAWGRLGTVLYNHIFGTEAIACFAEAERLEPSNPRWPYFQGLVQLSRDPPTALAKLRQAVELCRDETDGPRLRLAELHVWLGQAPEAREQFDRLLRSNDSHPRAHLGLARLDSQAGDSAKARDHLKQAYGDPHSRKSALTLSAEMYQRAGDQTAARRDRARAAEFPDDHEWPDKYLAEATQLKVGEVARVEIAGHLIDRGRTREAVQALEQIVRDYPQSVKGWTSLGWAQLNLKQLDAADASLKTAVTLEPEAARAWLYRAVVRFEKKDRKEAAIFLRRAIEAQPNYVLAHINLGLCLKDDGDPEGAIAAFESALRCQPLSAAAHSNLGALHLKQGRREKAIPHLEQAIALNPDDAASAKLLAEAKGK